MVSIKSSRYYVRIKISCTSRINYFVFTRDNCQLNISSCEPIVKQLSSFGNWWIFRLWGYFIVIIANSNVCDVANLLVIKGALKS